MEQTLLQPAEFPNPDLKEKAFEPELGLTPGALYSSLANLRTAISEGNLFGISKGPDKQLDRFLTKRIGTSES
jgi:hypothetical protein